MNQKHLITNVGLIVTIVGIVAAGYWYWTADNNPTEQPQTNFPSGEQHTHHSQNSIFSVTEKDISKKDETVNFEITGKIPVLEAEDPQVQSEINNIISSHVQKRFEEFKKGWMYLELQKDPSSSAGIDIWYEVLSNDPPVASFIFTFQYHANFLAHPSEEFVSLNYDTNAHKEIQLQDIFIEGIDHLSFLSTQARVQLKCNSTPNDVHPQGLCMHGTEPIEDNFRNFNLSKVGLEITFGPYQVASRVFGTPRLVIPYSKLEGVLRGQYLR